MVIYLPTCCKETKDDIDINYKLNKKENNLANVEVCHTSCMNPVIQWQRHQLSSAIEAMMVHFVAE